MQFPPPPIFPLSTGIIHRNWGGSTVHLADRSHSEYSQKTYSPKGAKNNEGIGFLLNQGACWRKTKSEEIFKTLDR